MSTANAVQLLPFLGGVATSPTGGCVKCVLQAESFLSNAADEYRVLSGGGLF